MKKPQHKKKKKHMKKICYSLTPQKTCYSLTLQKDYIAFLCKKGWEGVFYFEGLSLPVQFVARC